MSATGVIKDYSSPDGTYFFIKTISNLYKSYHAHRANYKKFDCSNEEIAKNINIFCATGQGKGWNPWEGPVEYEKGLARIERMNITREECSHYKFYDDWAKHAIATGFKGYIPIFDKNMNRIHMGVSIDAYGKLKENLIKLKQLAVSFRQNGAVNINLKQAMDFGLILGQLPEYNGYRKDEINWKPLETLFNNSKWQELDDFISNLLDIFSIEYNSSESSYVTESSDDSKCKKHILEEVDDTNPGKIIKSD